MKKRILDYLSFIDNKIALYSSSDSYTKAEVDEDINRHLIQISFFQHERLIHLIVTVLFAIVTIFSVLYNIDHLNITVFCLIILLLVLLIPYIKHYYLLENGVQKMYKQYDDMIKFKDTLI